MPRESGNATWPLYGSARGLSALFLTEPRCLNSGGYLDFVSGIMSRLQ